MGIKKIGTLIGASLVGLVIAGLMGACSPAQPAQSSATDIFATGGQSGNYVSGSVSDAFATGGQSDDMAGVPAPAAPSVGLAPYAAVGSGGSLAVSFGNHSETGSGGTLATDYADLKLTTAVMLGSEEIYPNGPGYVSDEGSTTVFGTLPSGQYFFQVLPSDAALNDGSVLPPRSYFVWGTNERVMTPELDAHYLDLAATLHSLKADEAGK